MGNELNFERDATVEQKSPVREVIIFEAKIDTSAGFEPVVADINRHEGSPKVIYLGDGSGVMVEKDLEALPAGTEVMGVGQYSRMRERWKSANTSLNYIYEGDQWKYNNATDYIIIQDISDIQSPTLRDINTTALRLLKIGGVMFIREGKEWKKLYKTRTGEFEDISASFTGQVKAA